MMCMLNNAILVVSKLVWNPSWFRLTTGIIWAQVRKFERFGACFCTYTLIIWSVLLHVSEKKKQKIHRKRGTGRHNLRAGATWYGKYREKKTKEEKETETVKQAGQTLFIGWVKIWYCGSVHNGTWVSIKQKTRTTKRSRKDYSDGNIL
jgi:hypothetical protein